MNNWLNKLYEFFMYGLVLLLCLSVILALGVKVYDSLNKVPYDIHGIVVEKHYTPASTSSGVGIAPQSGQPAVVTTHTSEKFVLIVNQSEDMVIWEVSRDVYMLSEVGKDVVLHCYQGPLTGTVSCK